MPPSAAISSPAKAADASERRLGLHIVRPGDTLMDITELYLGDPQLWPQNWRLNPALEDPNLLTPGARLQVLLPPTLPPRTALLIGTTRRVDDRPTPAPWTAAEQNDLLFPQDSVRTHRASSAELAFPDQTRLLLTEDSLVFLGDTRPMRQGIERRLIEIVAGQAELQSSAPTSISEEIEIVIGQARAIPRRDERGTLETRARRVGDGARVMVYRGQSEVQAAGQKVDVEQGMGTAVVPGAAPTPPEKLLLAPVMLAPLAGAERVERRPELRWQALEGASSYTVELCLDRRCGQLVQRVTELRQASWQALEELALGAYFWRVTGRSISGLDGYPSSAIGFQIDDLPLDEVPPRLGFEWVDGPTTTLDGQLIVGREARLRVFAEDAESGLDHWTGLLDGRQAAAERWSGPWSSGPHTLAALAVDRAGNETRSETLELIYDPDPPTISWGLEGQEARGRAQGTAASGSVGGSAGGLVELQWSGDMRQWLPTGRQRWTYHARKPWVMVRKHRGRNRWGVWSGDRARLRHRNEARQTMRMEFAGPRTTLRPRDGEVSLGDSGLVLTAAQGLWIEAEDALSRVELLSFQVLPGTAGSPARLVVEARDAVGNLSRLEWSLRP